MEKSNYKLKLTDCDGHSMEISHEGWELTYDDMRIYFATLAAFLGISINDLYDTEEN